MDLAGRLGAARGDRPRREVDAAVLLGADQPRRGPRDAPRDAGVAPRGDQAGAMGREGPRGAAREGARRGRPDHRAGARGPAPHVDEGRRRQARARKSRRGCCRRPRTPPSACAARPRTTSTRSSPQFEIALRKILEDAQATARSLAKTLDQVEVGRDRLRTPTTAAEQDARAARSAAGARGAVRRGGRRRGVRMTSRADRRARPARPPRARRVPSDLLGTIDGLATELVAVPDDAAARRRLAARVGGRGRPRHRLDHRHVDACGARDASPNRPQPFSVEMRELLTHDRARARRTPTTTAMCSPTEHDRPRPDRSATRSASRCRSRRCAGPTARACARSAAATATSASARATTRSIRGSRSWPTCCSISRRPTTRPEPGDQEEPDGSPQEEAEQDPHREAPCDVEGGADRVQLVSAVQAAQACRTACAGTAGTTPAGRPSRSSSRVRITR